MMLFGCLVGFGTTWLLARVSTLTELYVVLALAPIGAVSCTYIPVATVVARWFYRLRGIATGVAMLGLGLGGAVVPQIANWLLQTHTWRETYDLLALGYLAAMLPTLWWVRNPPADVEQAYTSNLPQDLSDDKDLTLGAALKTRSFWGLSLGDMVTGAIFSIFTFHLILYLTADLESQSTATNVFSLFMLLLAGGLGKGSAGLAFGFAVIAGLAGGGRSAVFPMGLAYSFGEKHMAAIWGVSNSMFMLGNGLGPPLAGMIYDRTHDSRGVYTLCIAGRQRANASRRDAHAMYGNTLAMRCTLPSRSMQATTLCAVVSSLPSRRTSYSCSSLAGVTRATLVLSVSKSS
jgi:MFS family permease